MTKYGLKCFDHDIGLSWEYENIAGEAKKNEKWIWTWTWAKWLAWLVQGLCTDSILEKVEVQGYVIVAQVS